MTYVERISMKVGLKHVQNKRNPLTEHCSKHIPLLSPK